MGVAHGHVAGRSAALHPHHDLRDLPLPLAARPGAGRRSARAGHRRRGSRSGGEADAWLNPTGASDAERKQRTLTNLYNARPAWLDLAHRVLDAAVLAAYGWPVDPSTGSGHGLSDDEILARLLALNLARRLLGAGRKFAPERDAVAELIQERATEG